MIRRKLFSGLVVIALILLIGFTNKASAGISTLATGLYQPGGIAASNGKVFMTETMCSTSGLGTISSISIDGGSKTVLATGLSYPFGIAAETIQTVMISVTTENLPVQTFMVSISVNQEGLLGQSFESLETVAISLALRRSLLPVNIL